MSSTPQYPPYFPPRAAGIGRVDIVESRFVGMKSRGVYETPGGTVLLTARRAIESICLDRGEAHLKVGLAALVGGQVLVVVLAW